MVNNLIRKKPNRLLIARNNYYSLGGIFLQMSDSLKSTTPLGIANAVGSAVGEAGGALLSLGMTSTAGNIVNGIGNIAKGIPGIGGLIGGAANIIGGGINALFGSKVNQEKVNAVNKEIANANNFTSSANNFDALTDAFANLATVGLFSKKDLGKEGLFSNKVTNLNNKLLSAALLARLNIGNQLANNANNLVGNQVSGLLANYSAFGGNLLTHGANFNTGLTLVSNGGTHESSPYEGVPMGVDQEGTPNLVEEGEVIFNNYVFSNRLKVPKAVRDKYKLRGNKPITFADAALLMSKESEERPNDPISTAGLEDSMMKLAAALEGMREKYNTKKNKFKTGGRLGNLLLGLGELPNFLRRGLPVTPFFGPDPIYVRGGYNSPAETKGGNLINPDMPYVTTPPPITSDIKGGPVLESASPSPVAKAAAIETQAKRNTPKEVENTTSNTNNSNTAPTWMRYVPAFASGIMSFTDALGLTNKPDFSDANAVLDYAKLAGTYQPVSFRPVGNYLTYTPFDIEYAANQANAESAAARRAIMNTSGGNRATAMASILAADNNALNQLGILRRSAAEDNRKQQQLVEDFNRATNEFNSEGFLKADMANQAALMQAKSTFLTGVLNAAELRQKERLAAATARSANLSNFINSIGDIGRENFARNMIVDDPSKYYTINADGTTTYKNDFDKLSEAEQTYIIGDATRKANAKKSTSKESSKKAHGGYLTIKNRRK